MKFISKISFRMLIFNVLVVFLPVMGLLYLDTYEKQLLEAQEDSMVQQGRLIASSITAFIEMNPPDTLETEKVKTFSRELIIKLKKRTEARLRIIGDDRMLVADSALEEIQAEERDQKSNFNSRYNTESGGTKDETPVIETSFLYELASLPVRLYRKYFEPPQPEINPTTIYNPDKAFFGPEINAALNGQYGAITRLSAGGQQSVTLYVAIPIMHHEKTEGAVLISQSSYRILKNLYEVRLGIFRIFLFSLGAALIINLFLSFTISRPLNKIKKDAELILDSRGRLMRPINTLRRRDEIGILSHTLSDLTEQVKKHIQFIESFAADLTHEFKNPLSSIRSATEIALETGANADRNHFLHLVQKDITRMENLLNGVREISLIDTRLNEDESRTVEINSLLENCINRFRLCQKSIPFVLTQKQKPLYVLAAPERVEQVFTNLLDNAVSFTDPEKGVKVIVDGFKDIVQIQIIDSGPGIPAEHQDKIFHRFFTDRPGNNEKQSHTGLGLSIVKAIVEGYKGTVYIKPNTEKKPGAAFIVTLPRHVPEN